MRIEPFLSENFRPDGESPFTPPTFAKVNLARYVNIPTIYKIESGLIIQFLYY